MSQVGVRTPINGNPPVLNTSQSSLCKGSHVLWISAAIQRKTNWSRSLLQPPKIVWGVAHHQGSLKVMGLLKMFSLFSQ